MTKAKHLSVIAVLIIILFLSETNAYADLVPNPIDTKLGYMIMTIITIIVFAIGLIAWLIIRLIRKKIKSRTI